MFNFLKKLFKTAGALPPQAPWSEEEADQQYALSLQILLDCEPDSPHLKTDLAKQTIAEYGLKPGGKREFKKITDAEPVKKNKLQAHREKLEKERQNAPEVKVSNVAVAPAQSKPAIVTPPPQPDDADEGFSTDLPILLEADILAVPQLKRTTPELESDMQQAFGTLTDAIQQGITQATNSVTPIKTTQKIEHEVVNESVPPTQTDIIPQPLVIIPFDPPTPDELLHDIDPEQESEFS